MEQTIFIKHNLLRLQENFGKWLRTIPDSTDAFERFIPEFQKSREGWILSGRTVDGIRFAPLSPKYKAWKDRHYPGRPILIRTGRLLSAVTGGPGWFHRSMPKELRIYITVPYSSYLQDGTSKMPQRNFFLSKDGTLVKGDYAKLLQAMEGKIQESVETILNKNIIQLVRGW